MLSTKRSLFGEYISFFKEHSKILVSMGILAGAILVIYYCGSIEFYPSGLTLADTLFFLWSVAVFGFYYSAVAFAFFIASLFWVTILSKPINFTLRILGVKIDIIVPFPKSDLLMIIGSGLLVNLIIGYITYAKGHSFILIASSVFVIGFIYTLADNISKKVSVDNVILDSSGNPINLQPIKPETIRLIFYAFIYSVPLLLAQVGGGVTRTTFETMGIRKENVTVSIEAKNYKQILGNYKNEGLISSLKCDEVCTLTEIDVLFTSIGTKTKLQAVGPEGSVNLVFPTKVITLISQSKPNK